MSKTTSVKTKRYVAAAVALVAGAVVGFVVNRRRQDKKELEA
jgi:uncharacterized membrane-anchored protein YhcB (DUF1043 family)